MRNVPNKYRIVTNGVNFQYEIGSYFCGMFKSGYRWTVDWHMGGFKTYAEAEKYIKQRFGSIADIDRPYRPA